MERRAVSQRQLSFLLHVHTSIKSVCISAGHVHNVRRTTAEHFMSVARNKLLTDDLWAYKVTAVYPTVALYTLRPVSFVSPYVAITS